MHKSYLTALILFSLPIAALAGMNYLYLRNAGEFLSVSDIVSMQQEQDGFCIYGTALHDDTFAYKKEAYARTKPEVVMVGSSLVMEVRDRFFKGTFYNMGGTMDSIVNGTHTVTHLLENDPPKVLLLGIDWWWFRAGTQPYERTKPPEESPRFTIQKVFRPFSWIAKGDLSMGEYVRTMLGNRTENQEKYCAIGVQSQERRRGFAVDGSYYYTGILTGEKPTEPGFNSELRDIRAASGRFAAGSGINLHTLQGFVDLIHAAEAKGVKTVLFLQPPAPTVWAEMQKHPEQYAYITELKRALTNAGIKYEDFLDARSLNSPDCEFIDGLHGGDVTYARLLRKLYERQRDPAIRNVFNVETIDAVIADAAGFAMAPDPRVTALPEVDFLQLGCEKQ